MSNVKRNPILWTILVLVGLAATTDGGHSDAAASAGAEELALLTERDGVLASSRGIGDEELYNVNPNSPSVDCSAALGPAGSASAFDRQLAGSTAPSPEDRPPSFMPPHPALLERARRGEVTLPEFVTDPAVRQQLGIEQPQGVAAGPQGSWKALALLVEFTDNPSQVGASYFDTLLFGNGMGTLKDYFSAVSYGSLDIITVNLPSTIGWCTMPQTYAYYVDGNNGLGSYPRNAQKLAEDAVLVADPIVDYGQYDNNSDGWVDTVFIIHAGPGAEFTGSANHIWSHSWATVTNPMVDGVRVNSYTAEPEYWLNPPDMTVGVFAHELGHVFGLPDLYDTDGSSAGIGGWSLMAGGAWNGTLGDSPALPDPWSRAALDFVTPLNVVTDLTGVSFPPAATSQTVYRLWTNGASASEYFLVENRQQSGYDAGLPAAGLLIWHVDESKGGNQAECDQLNNWSCGPSHQKVALEQADGLWDLEHNTDSGDGGDPYPGTTNNRGFTSSTTPNSSAYGHSSDTCVEVSGISNSGPTMTADLSVSCDLLDVGPLVVDGVTVDDDNDGNSSGNNDGLVDCGEDIELAVDLANQGTDAAIAVSAAISTGDPYVTWLFNTVSDYGDVGGGGTGTNGDDFVLAVDAATPPGHVIDFDLDISADNGGPWSDSFSLTVSCVDTTPGSLEGRVLLQGRSNNAGAEICAWDGNTTVACTITNASGYFILPAMEGVYDLTVEMASYLDGERAAVTVTAGTTATLPALTLKGGDTNDDDVVNNLDLSFMSDHYGLSCGQLDWDDRADVNADCSVNIQDLAIAGGNFQESSPVNWPLATPIAVSGSNGATIWLQGPSEPVHVGEEITVTIHISDAADLYAAQLALSFAAGDVQVVDGEPETQGVQIREGTCPAPDFVVSNAADNAGGTIEYALTQLNPRAPVNGGCVVAAIRLRLLEAGLTTIQLSEAILSDPDGQSLPFDSTDLTIVVKAEFFTFLPFLLTTGSSN